MVNEEILTGLKNAVDHGDSLDSAIRTAIASGYNPKEVQEAARFVGQGILPSLQSRPEEHLAMPNQKFPFSIMSKSQPIPIKTVQTNPAQIRPIQTQQIPVQQIPVQQMPNSVAVNASTQEFNQIKKEIYTPQNTYSTPTNTSTAESTKIISQGEMQQMSLKKPSYLKEIILGIILFMLLGALGITIFFKSALLSFFSGA